MSYLGEHNHCRTPGSVPAPDAGKGFLVSDPFSRRMASVVVRLSAAEKFRKRSHAVCRLFVRDANARLISVEGICAAIHPKHDLFCQQDRPA